MQHRIERQFLWNQVAEQVGELIRTQRLWGRCLASERELAQMFGVSRPTVRCGLEILERKGMIRRIQGKGTLVLPKPGKQWPRDEKRIVLGSLFPIRSSSFFGHMACGVMTALDGRFLSLTYSNMAEVSEREILLRDLAAGRTNGVLLLTCADRAFVAAVLRASRGAVVLLDHYFDDLPVTGVVDDGAAAARQAVEHLLAFGHRRIGFVDVTRRELNPWRHAGYTAALRDAGLPYDPELVAPATTATDAVRLAADRLLALSHPPTAIIAFDRLRVAGIEQAANGRGLELGRDLAVVTFGCRMEASSAIPAVTCVEFDAGEVGRLGVGKLVEQIEGRGTRGALIKVPSALVVGRSSCRAPAGRDGVRA